MGRRYHGDLCQGGDVPHLACAEGCWTERGGTLQSFGVFVQPGIVRRPLFPLVPCFAAVLHTSDLFAANERCCGGVHLRCPTSCSFRLELRPRARRKFAGKARCVLPSQSRSSDTRNEVKTGGLPPMRSRVAQDESPPSGFHTSKKGRTYRQMR